MKKNYAVAYCRVSTEEQVNKGFSLDVQEEACVEAIKNDGFELFEIIRDEGKSAGSLKRPGIQKVMELTVNKKIQAVYAISGDRLTRNTLDHLQLRNLLRKNSVELKYVYQPLADDSPTSRTMDTIMATFNELQRLTTGEKVKKTLRAKAEAGYFPSYAPLGYKNIENPDPNTARIAKKIIVPCEKSAPFITELFEMYATGNYNVYDLNDILYEKGLRAKTGKKVQPSLIYEILRNKIYIGEVRWGEIIVPNGKHTPLTDKFTFDRVQLILEGNNKHTTRRRKHNWLLSGFVFCPKHGKRFTAEWHLDKKLAYYHCSNKHGCGKYVEKTNLEMKVAEKFKNLEFNKEFIDAVIKKVKEVYYERKETFEGKKQGLINQRTALEKRKTIAEEKLLTEVISDSEFKTIRDNSNTEIESINQRIHDLEIGQDIKTDLTGEILGFTRSIYQTYISAPEPIKRMYLSLFWERFEVEDGTIIKSVPSVLFRELLGLEQAFYKNKKIEKTSIHTGNSKVILRKNLLRAAQELRTVILNGWHSYEMEAAVKMLRGEEPYNEEAMRWMERARP